MQAEKSEPIVLIYDGCGTDYECVDWSLQAFRSLLPDPSMAITVDAKTILDKKWMSTAKILVIPGGRATPYHDELGEIGMENIRNFVHSGNTLIGICAGAYFLAADSNFAIGTKFEVVNKHLGLFPGEVKGPFFEDFNYLEDTIRGAISKCSDGVERIAYHHGGGWFVKPEEHKDISVLARYSSDEARKDGLAAIIKVKYGDGCVIGSHMHFEEEYSWNSWKEFIFNALEHEKCLVYNNEQSITV